MATAVKTVLTKKKSLDRLAKHQKEIAKLSANSEIVKMTPEQYESITEMFSSKDTANHMVAQTIMTGLSVQLNLLYVMMALRDFSSLGEADQWKKTEEQVKKIYVKVTGVTDSTKDRTETDTRTFNAMYYLAKGYYPQDLQFVIDRWMAFIRLNLHKWGWTFQKELDIFAKVKGEE